MDTGVSVHTAGLMHAACHLLGQERMRPESCGIRAQLLRIGNEVDGPNPVESVGEMSGVGRSAA